MLATLHVTNSSNTHTLSLVVWQGCYDKKVDVWACGVMLYMLLCGRPPFDGVTDQRVYDQILNSYPTFTGDVWNNISQPAKVMQHTSSEQSPAGIPNGSLNIIGPSAYFICASHPGVEKLLFGLLQVHQQF